MYCVFFCDDTGKYDRKLPSITRCGRTLKSLGKIDGLAPKTTEFVGDMAYGSYGCHLVSVSAASFLPVTSLIVRHLFLARFQVLSVEPVGRPR